MTNVLITGASGFVGLHLTAYLLNKNMKVHTFIHDHDRTRPYFQLRELKPRREFQGDLRNYRDVERAVLMSEPEIIYHLGALTQVTECRRSPLQVFQTNIMGTAHVLEAARRIYPEGISVVVASSDKAYGHPLLGRLPLKESDPFRVFHPYDTSKACADLIAQAHAGYHEERVAVLRPANIYGPGDVNWKRLIPGVARDLLEGHMPVIRSDGQQVRQYLYVDDAVRAYHKVGWMLRDGFIPRGQVFNLAPDDEYTVVGVVERLIKLVRPGAKPVILGEAQDEVPVMRIDGQAARDQLQWEPRVAFERGLEVTVSWVRNYREHWS